MYVKIFLLFIILVTKTYGISLPYIQDVFLQSSTNANPNTTVYFNGSCPECLCENFISNNNTKYVALNCFQNETCQFFQSFPSSYKLNQSFGARLYFLQNKFPSSSMCCMSNITELLTQLKTGVNYTTNLNFEPSALGYDEVKPNEAAVIEGYWSHLYWFNPLTMTSIQNSWIKGSSTITLYNNRTFTGSNIYPRIYIIDSQTHNNLGNISYSSLTQSRKLVFMNDGQTLIVSTPNNNSLTIFNRSSPINYTFQQVIPFPFGGTYGIAKVNDTFFYASLSYGESIISYKYENLTWTYEIFVNYTATGYGTHLAVDECERIWFVIPQFGLRIYDPFDVEIGNWNMSLDSSNTIYDILFLPNYVLLVKIR